MWNQEIKPGFSWTVSLIQSPIPQSHINKQTPKIIWCYRNWNSPSSVSNLNLIVEEPFFSSSSVWAVKGLSSGSEAQPEIQINFKMISSENSTTKGLHELCLLCHRAGLWHRAALTYVWGDCALSCKKPINCEFLITFLMAYCVKPPIISTDDALVSSSSLEKMRRRRRRQKPGIKSSAGWTEVGITRKKWAVRQTAALLFILAHFPQFPPPVSQPPSPQWPQSETWTLELHLLRLLSHPLIARRWEGPGQPSASHAFNNVSREKHRDELWGHFSLFWVCGGTADTEGGWFKTKGGRSCTKWTDCGKSFNLKY